MPISALPLRSLSAIALLVLGACARPSTTAPTPVMQPPITVSPPADPPAAEPAPKVEQGPDSALADWHRRAFETDGILGIGSERAIRELLGNRTPKRQVIVAVIDGGLDTTHAMLRGVAWKNAKEIAGNGRDDDRNGYVDDTWGWNTLATPTGETIGPETFEITRVYAACRGQPAGRGIAKPSATRCDSVSAAYQEKVQEVTGTLQQVRNIGAALDRVVATLTPLLNGQPLTTATVRAIPASTPPVQQAKSMFLQLAANDITPDVISEARKVYESQAKYSLDTLYQPRGAMLGIGSRDVMGPDASHGTHVAGIIGAVRNGQSLVQGIAPNVQLMTVRAVPDGDERDEDVARAIRYAVDNGAQIINMSFGKAWSPSKAVVDSAVRYASSKGVLLVHAAGNEAANNDVDPSFPTPVYTDGTRATHWLEVGASSWKGQDQLVAPFSNYGQSRVDLFAPGVDILSTVPGGGVKRESGTSMAAPVVSGVAALLMAYFPSMTALQAKEIMLSTVRTFPDLQVVLPGSPQRVPFARLSRTGGLVDAYAAVKKALDMERVP